MNHVLRTFVTCHVKGAKYFLHNAICAVQHNVLLMQGINFLDFLYSIFLQRKLNQDYVASEMYNWLKLLFRLVDITGNSALIHLDLFISGKQLIMQSYRQVSKKIVCIYYFHGLLYKACIVRWLSYNVLIHVFFMRCKKKGVCPKI